MTHEIQRWLAHRLGPHAWTRELWFCQDGRLPMRYAYEEGARERFEYPGILARKPLVPFTALTLPL